jgi:ribokinase
MVTLAAEGAGHYRDGHLVLHQPAARVEALSTHGAGDHFVGALASGLARGLPLEATLREASDAAGEWVRSLRKDVLRIPGTRSRRRRSRPSVMHTRLSRRQA